MISSDHKSTAGVPENEIIIYIQASNVDTAQN